MSVPLHSSKSDLSLRNPLLVAAGCYGLGTEYRGLLAVERLGAVIVGPVTMRARPGAAPPRAVPLPGGLLLHTGLDNPGLSVVLRRFARAWARIPTAVIFHLAATTPGEVAAAGLRLSGVDALVAVELGLPDGADPDEVAALVGAARSALTLPLLVRLPLSSAVWLAEAAVEGGADALTVGAPPRGTAVHEGRFVTGRLYGPLVHPLALRALRQVAGSVKVPLIGCGGVYSTADARAFLQAGAVAVQVDAALWRDPAGVGRMAQELAAAPA